MRRWASPSLSVLLLAQGELRKSLTRRPGEELWLGGILTEG